MEFKYGDRCSSYEVVTTGEDVDGVVVFEKTINDNERVEIYDYEGNYSAKTYDLLTFYHTPRYHWGHEGDFFGLLRETTDMKGQDIWNSKAPFGLEFQGKEYLDGLKFLMGQGDMVEIQVLFLLLGQCFCLLPLLNLCPRCPFCHAKGLFCFLPCSCGCDCQEYTDDSRQYHNRSDCRRRNEHPSVPGGELP